MHGPMNVKYITLSYDICLHTNKQGYKCGNEALIHLCYNPGTCAPSVPYALQWNEHNSKDGFV
jgi:hypothetical protein